MNEQHHEKGFCLHLLKSCRLAALGAKSKLFDNADQPFSSGLQSEILQIMLFKPDCKTSIPLNIKIFAVVTLQF